MKPEPGIGQEIEPGLRMVLAPNPSPMTHWGTNTFLLGEGDVAVIDPGPSLPAHQAAILAALRPGERISHILVTHAHLDHSPLAPPLAEATGAEVLAFGDARSGLSPRMTGVTGLGGGEGLDLNFTPDRCLADGEVLRGDGWALEVLHTPGHLGGHICLGWEDRLFTGDHVMGWAPSLVSPPEGDMTDYMASLQRLAHPRWQRFLPAHGAAIETPAARLSELIAHRRARESRILASLDRPRTLEALLAEVYHDTAPTLLPAARRNLLSHLLDLLHRNAISQENKPLPEARFQRR